MNEVAWDPAPLVRGLSVSAGPRGAGAGLSEMFEADLPGDTQLVTF